MCTDYVTDFLLNILQFTLTRKKRCDVPMFAKVQSNFLRLTQYGLHCVLWVSAVRNFGLGLLQVKHLANGDQWKEGNAG